MEAFVHLEKNLFTSYKYTPPEAPPSSQDDPPEHPIFEINLISLLETLNIFSVSDPSTAKRSGDEYSAFAAHRLNRHANQNAFNNPLHVSGICTFSYDGEGSALSIHMSEAGVTTTCDLTTYEAEVSEEIPFQRENLALKAIMRSTFLLDTLSELSNMNPTNLTIQANPDSRSNSNLSLSASGPLGSSTIDFTTQTESETPILETFQCSAKTSASFKFSCIKAAQRAMQSASKVSMRLDDDGVLSLQFLVEIGYGEGDGAAFVDFRIVPLVEGEADDEYDSESSD